MTKLKPKIYQTQLIAIDCFQFQKDFLEWTECNEDGTYTMQVDIVMDLKSKPRSGAVGDGWILSNAGQLTLLKGYTWNGPNVVQDAVSKMLASAVHDVLCTKECWNQYGYWRKQAIYTDIMKAQHSGWFAAEADRLGLLLGCWTSILRNKKK